MKVAKGWVWRLEVRTRQWNDKLDYLVDSKVCSWRAEDKRCVYSRPDRKISNKKLGRCWRGGMEMEMEMKFMRIWPKRADLVSSDKGFFRLNSDKGSVLPAQYLGLGYRTRGLKHVSPRK